MKKYFPYSAIILLFIYSCKDNVKVDNLQSWDDQYSLNRVGEITFPLDSTTARIGNPNGYNSDLGIFYLFNRNNYQLYLYNVGSKKLERTVQYDKEGPDGLSNVNGILMHSLDSIMTYDRKYGLFTIANDDGKVIGRRKVIEPEEPQITYRSNFKYNKGNVYFSVTGYYGIEKSLAAKSVLVYNLKTEQREFLLDTPNEYVSNYWGDRSIIRDIALVEGNSVVSSWTMGPELRVRDFSTNTTKSVAYKSDRLFHTEPLEEKAAGNKTVKDRYALTNSWFESLFYAEDQNILLRSASVGMKIPKGAPLYERHPSRSSDNAYALTELYNEQFEKIGEVPHLHFIKDIFSTKQAIYIMDREYKPDNEDILPFAKYELVKKEINHD